MAIVRFRPFSQSMDDPFRDVTDMQGQMNRLFDNLLGRPSPMAGMERMWAPAVDMYETKDELVIAAELPGLNQKDIHLSITGDMLTIRGAAAAPGHRAGQLLPGRALVGQVRADVAPADAGGGREGEGGLSGRSVDRDAAEGRRDQAERDQDRPAVRLLGGRLEGHQRDRRGRSKRSLRPRRRSTHIHYRLLEETRKVSWSRAQ